MSFVCNGIIQWGVSNGKQKVHREGSKLLNFRRQIDTPLSIFQVGKLLITFTKYAITNAHGTQKIKFMLIAIAFSGNQGAVSLRGRERIYQITVGERYRQDFCKLAGLYLSLRSQSNTELVYRRIIFFIVSRIKFCHRRDSNGSYWPRLFKERITLSSG